MHFNLTACLYLDDLGFLACMPLIAHVRTIRHLRVLNVISVGQKTASGHVVVLGVGQRTPARLIHAPYTEQNFREPCPYCCVLVRF